MGQSVSRVSHYLLVPRPYPGKLSLVAPMYNEEETIPLLRAAVESFMTEVSCTTEVVLVNDGSRDGTIDLLIEWAQTDERIKVIHLSRNFGHQIAATAGLDRASGDAVVLIDADLQDPLPVVHEMIKRYCEGYDVAYGQRETRIGESRMKLATAWLFYRLMRRLVYKDLPLDAGDFRLISRPCLNGLLRMRETHRFLRGMTAWVGYPQVAVPYRRAARAAGETKYPLRKMLAFAWTAATSFSTVPLRLSFAAASAAALLSLEEGVRGLCAHMFGYTVSGWTSLTILLSAIGAALLFSVGILGEYVAKIYEQEKHRPLYLAAHTFNLGDETLPHEQVARASVSSNGQPDHLSQRIAR
jgi:glycosyltransferase involved in cell wall biosynthesis